MNTLTDSTISIELQKLYVKTKEMRLGFLLLKDEMLFCQFFFNHVLSKKVERESLPKIEMIRSTLDVIFERLGQLKDSLQFKECKLTKLSRVDSMEIGASMNKDEDDIFNEILLLSHAQKLIKEDLWALFKRQQLIQLPILQTNDLPVKTQSYIRV